MGEFIRQDARELVAVEPIDQAAGDDHDSVAAAQAAGEGSDILAEGVLEAGNVLPGSAGEEAWLAGLPEDSQEKLRRAV